MRKTCMVSFPKCAAILLLLQAVPVISLAQTAAKNRIAQAIDDSQRTVVQGNLHPMARPEFDQGRADGSMPINHASIVFKPSPGQQRTLDALLAAQQDPSSPNYHQWLTPEQYADRFGMTPSDIAKVVSWLQSKGLTVQSTARSRNEVFFAGTVAQIEFAFNTEIHHYLVNGEQHFANATEPSVPAAFAHTALGFHGFDDFRPKPRVRKAHPHFTSHVSGKHFLTPGDFATIYDLGPLYAASPSLDGTGQKIAVVGDSAITLSDIETFRTLSGLLKNDPQIVIVPNTGTPTHNSDEVEADLDLEWSGAVARNATIIYVVVGPAASHGAFDALTFAIQNSVAPVISNSFGNCEANLGAAFVQSLQRLAQQANAQGQTITSATGDTGAADCESATAASATHGLAVDVPASIPEVTGVGGSEFTGDLAGTVTGTPPNTNATATTFWSGTTNSTDTIDSVLSYIPEMVWNDTAVSVSMGQGLSAGGGGASALFSKPSWQTGTGVPSDNARDVPDISLNASPFHDAYLMCSPPVVSTDPHPCTNGFRDGNSNLDTVGGTSAGAPTFAGIVAIINQATNANGQGNVNPTLYNLFQTESSSLTQCNGSNATTPPASTCLFRDITTGNNIVPCTPPNSTNCPASGQIGFSAGTGYDQASGLGSVDANNLVNAWPPDTTGHYSILPPNPTTITISAPGGSGTSTISVAAKNGFIGTVNLSCALTPASSTAKITCGFTSPTTGATTSVMLTSTTTTASATLTVSTMAPHAISSISASARPHGRLGWFAASGGALLAGILVMGVPSRRRRWGAVLGLLLFAFLAAGIGCGGGSNTPPPVITPGTPVGNYIITVTSSSGTTSLPDLVTVNVQ